MDQYENFVSLRPKSEPPDLGNLDKFLEERKYFVDKWLETEKNIFLSLLAVVGIPAALGIAGDLANKKLALMLLSLLAMAVVWLLTNRMEVIQRHIEEINKTITFIDEHMSYSDTSLRPGKWIKLPQRFIVTNMKRMRLLYLTLGLILSWCPVAINAMMK